MDTAVWLFLGPPAAYFLTILLPVGVGALALVPATGVVGLAIGVGLGLRRRQKELLIFLVLPAASQALVIASGLMLGAVATSGFIFWTFPALQAVAAGYLVFRLKGARAPASGLAVFSVSYALFAAGLASMALANVWL